MRPRRVALVGVAAMATVLIVSQIAAASVPLNEVSADPYTNSTSQHATELEPDTFAFGSTVVAAFQVGRFFDGGASDIGFVRSTNGGASWNRPGFLHLTSNSGGPHTYERVSDPSVAYDAAHDTWLISSIPLLSTLSVPTVFVNRSTNGGVTWTAPVSIPPPVSNSIDLDKNWTVCDNVSLRFKGHCYTEFDNFGDGGRELMSTSTDGGSTWSTPIQTAGHDKGLGGQPVVQPSGRVIVPFESFSGKIEAFYSDDGGASWTAGTKVASIAFHGVAGGLRTSPLPSAEVAGDGTVYVAWEDCRFRAHCAANDIVLSKSSDGVTWTDPVRVPIDAVTSTVDHFIPGLGVNPATSGSATQLALSYYFYPQTNCGGACRLQAGYISSPDGGAHWGTATQLGPAMALSEIAPTSQGPMVGDYISTSFSGGKAVTVVAVGATPSTNAFDEAMYAPAPQSVATAAQAVNVASSAGAGPITGVGTGETHRALKND